MLESFFNKNLFAKKETFFSDVMVLFLNVCQHLTWQLPRADVDWKGCIPIRFIYINMFDIYINMLVSILDIQILILSCKMHSLEISYFQKI